MGVIMDRKQANLYPASLTKRRLRAELKLQCRQLRMRTLSLQLFWGEADEGGVKPGHWLRPALCAMLCD